MKTNKETMSCHLVNQSFYLYSRHQPGWLENVLCCSVIIPEVPMKPQLMMNRWWPVHQRRANNWPATIQKRSQQRSQHRESTVQVDDRTFCHGFITVSWWWCIGFRSLGCSYERVASVKGHSTNSCLKIADK